MMRMENGCLAILGGCLLLCGFQAACSPNHSDQSRLDPSRRDAARVGAPAPPGTPTPGSTNFGAAAAPGSSGETATGPLRFVDVGELLGLRFSHHSPLTPQRHIHLFLGSGIGWLDYDRDGWPDLFCAQGAGFPPGGPADTGSAGITNTLYRNRGGRDLDDVTLRAGLENVDYSMGVAAADYNNDGFVDVCVTGYGRNDLYRNNGDGSFARVRLPADQQPGRLSSSCTWVDVDADGNLDLFIANYARLGPDNYPLCEHTSAGITIPISCHPSQIEAQHDLIYRNTGRGTFEDFSDRAGITASSPRAGLGVVAADLDRDGDIDLYVANDTTENQLWENQGSGRFVDRGAASGTSRNRHGENEAGMGLVAGDLTGRGRVDLFVCNYYGETNTLYRNEGRLLFADITAEAGLGAPSRLRLGFGTSLADFDQDGWADLLIANGHVQDRLPEVQRNEPFAQRLLLFHSQRGVRYREVAAQAGAFLASPHVARSTAIADFDRDGDPDAAINCLHARAALLRNDSDPQGNWIRLELIGRSSNRQGVGAAVRLTAGDRLLLRTVQAGTGYLSSDESTILMGVGPHAGTCDVSVVWPGGLVETWDTLAVNRSWRLVQGAGQVANTPP